MTGQGLARRILVLAVLALALAWPWAVPLPQATLSGAARVADTTPAPPAPLPPLAALTASRDRPLFAATRRPSPAAGAGQGALILGRYRLRGVVISGTQRLVLLVPDGGGRTLQLGEGGHLENWTIEKIAPETMILRDGDRREQVPLGKASP